MKKFLGAFITIGIIICILPLAGMIFRPTTVSTENKRMAEFPSVTKPEGGLNLEFFQGFEDYFGDHFAFRNELIFADAMIQGKAFKTSNVDTVIVGKDGWLYYASTLKDYLGEEKMTARQIKNLAHNLEIVKTYMDEKKVDFLLTIPPNKNTLYGENMPYYYVPATGHETHNVDNLTPLLIEKGIPYSDLFQLFRNEDEVLYLKRDSHWNMKGALMAYNLMMDDLEKTHKDYSDVDTTRVNNEDGDLNRMLYTLYGSREMNYKYELGQEPMYIAGDGDVESVWIETSFDEGQGTLLMFRDSFANTLIPFLSRQYKTAYFTKEVPYGLEALMDEHAPDTVILEKVERNISEFISMPPIISAPEAEIPAGGERQNVTDAGVDFSFKSFEFDSNYYIIKGTLDSNLTTEDTEVFAEINGKAYHAYQTDEFGFELYIKKDMIPSLPVAVKIITSDGGKYTVVSDKVINEGDIE